MTVMSGLAPEPPVDLRIGNLVLFDLHGTCNVTVTHHESAVGLLEK